MSKRIPTKAIGKRILKQTAIATVKSLFHESDRGCVILVNTMLEKNLCNLHEAHIATVVYPSKRYIFADLSNVHAPLSTSAGLMQIAYAYGLISEEDYDDLQTIRKLRNEAAHSRHDFNLEDIGCRQFLKRLTAATRDKQTAEEFSKIFLEAGHSGSVPSPSEAKRLLLTNFALLQNTLLGMTEKALGRLIVLRKKR